MDVHVSILRLSAMRLVFLLNLAVLGSDVWPELLARGATMEPLRGVAFAFWGTLSLLSALGLRYPLKLLPLLLFQLAYKIIWLGLVAAPQWLQFKDRALTHVMLFGLVVDLLLIPWPLVVRRYVREAGDRWWNG